MRRAASTPRWNSSPGEAVGKSILIERDGHIATLVLNSGARLNALDMQSWVQLNAAVAELAADDEVRCVVLRGAGDQAFAAGADITEFETVRADSRSGKEYGDLVSETFVNLAACPHPTIAMIKGVCVGGGLEIASACDMRICGRSSRFGVPINRLGLVVGYPELEHLLALVGWATVAEILFEGRIFNAAEAASKGLVNRVVADDAVEEEAWATARRIAAGAPLVARWHKKFAHRLKDPAPLTQAELDEAYACYDTEDYRTGRQSFIDRTRPDFKGR